MRAQPVLITPSQAVENWTFRVELSKDWRILPHLGSLLRGAFGHALRDLACCGQQPHLQECVYARIFEPMAPTDWPKRFNDCPPSFVISPPPFGAAHGRTFGFSMTLLGTALANSELVSEAWQLAASRGLGVARVPGTITVRHRTPLLPLHCGGTLLRWRITTPMLLKQQQPNAPKRFRLGADQVTLGALLEALHRRLDLTHRLYAVPALPPPSLERWLTLGKALDFRSELQDVEFGRHSNRQNRSMPLAGIIGKVHLRGAIDQELLDALVLGQWLHIGGKTSFGLGGYSMNFLDAPGVRLYTED